MRNKLVGAISTLHPAGTARAAKPRRGGKDHGRWGITLLALLPLFLVASPGPPAVAAGGANTWSPTGKMSIGRTRDTATLLPNGRVLVAGGDVCQGNFQIIVCLTIATAELYNPATGVWTSTGKMQVARSDYTATLLPNGKVLVAGGQDCPTIFCYTLTSAELYDPSTGTWSTTGAMTTARLGQTATLLRNGQVLVAGGGTASAELYNPRTGVWTATGSMSVSREFHTATLLHNGQVLAAGGDCCGPSTAELYNPNTGTWTLTGMMTTGRSYHTATLLPNGKVLAAGGDCCATAELYDPSTGTWTATGSMTSGRSGHTATLLPDGRVLVAGGDCCGTAELYDPISGTWTATGSMSTARQLFTATLLPNGTVLAAGGQDSYYHGTTVVSANIYTPGAGPLLQFTPSSLDFGGRPVGSSTTHMVTITNTGTLPLTVSGVTVGGDTADFPTTTTCTTAPIAPAGTCTISASFTPQTTLKRTATITLTDNAPNSPQTVPLNGFGAGPDSWQPTASMSVTREGHTATLLTSGKVLVAGGNPGLTGSAELYDLRTRGWTPTGAMTALRSNHTATLLPNGLVLVAGGTNFNTPVLASAELYNPATNSWAPTASMSVPRVGHTATLLANGKVLVAGGSTLGGVSTSSAELYDPTTGAWTPTGAMNTARQDQTATLLADGTVLVAGGETCTSSTCTILASAEIYNPGTGTWTLTGAMTSARVFHTATPLPSGQVLVAGGWETIGLATNSAEVYDPATGAWTATGAMSTVRHGHSATLLPTGSVLVAGGQDNNNVALSSAELYDPDTATWSPTGSLNNGRQFQTATLLPTGSVLVAGGDHPCCIPTASAELYTPALLAASPSSGTVGQSVTVSGTNYFAGETVQVYWDVTGTAPLTTTTTANDGSFRATFLVPPTAPGAHTIIAVGQDSDVPASTPFQVE